MPMQPDANRPGLWTNSDWIPGQGPGTFAVVIGSSSYYHLIDGTKLPLAAEPYGLKQLNVSAYTAYKFFEWLSTRYRHTEAPLAQCWLLLSPTSAERQFEPGMPVVPEATMRECKGAILEWFTAMEKLPPEHAEKSRSLFFFSGHGLEIATDRQILLPCDYLSPPGPVLNDAISTYNLYGGLRKLAIGEQIFMLDACRNDHAELRQADLKGADILNVWPAYQSNPDLIAPLVYATASGQQAWEPNSPDGGISLFGQALLEGLSLEAGMSADCVGGTCNIQLLSLVPFLTRRVQKLHEDRGSRVRQGVRLGGSIADITVTEVKRVPKMAMPVPQGDSDGGAAVGDAGTAPAGRGFAPAPAPVPADVPDFHAIPLPPGGVASVPAKTFQEMHDVFGSEVVSEMWEKAALIPLAGATPNDNRPPSYTITEVERGSDGLSWRVELTVDALGPHWLELRLGTERFACVLPDDLSGRPIYELEFLREHGTGLLRFEVGLSEKNRDFLGDAARLAQRYKRATFGDAPSVSDARQLMEIVMYKTQSPLAATIAALVLTRTPRTTLPLDWLRNLAGTGPHLIHESFARRPDGPVLLVEHLLRETGKTTRAANPSAQGTRALPLRTTHPVLGEEIVSALLSLETRGLPHTGDALTYLMRQLGELLSCGIGASPDGKSEDDDRRRLEQLRDRVTAAMPVYRSGGLFAAFIGTSSSVSPSLIQ